MSLEFIIRSQPQSTIVLRVQSVLSLNEMIDNQEKYVNAIRDRVPNIVFLTLYGIAAVASGFSGYASGLGAAPVKAAGLCHGRPGMRRYSHDPGS